MKCTCTWPVGKAVLRCNVYKVMMRVHVYLTYCVKLVDFLVI